MGGSATAADILDELKGMAALLVALARMDGYRFERGITRHNDIAAAAVFYGSLGGGFSPEIARDSLRECVRCCGFGLALKRRAGAASAPGGVFVLSSAPRPASWLPLECP